METTKTSSPKRKTAAKPSKPTAEAPTPTVAKVKPINRESPDGTPTDPPKPINKQLQLAALLVRDEGATLDQMVAATGWLPHTVRAALTGLKKKRYALSSDKLDGVRTYRAVAPE